MRLAIDRDGCDRSWLRAGTLAAPAWPGLIRRPGFTWANKGPGMKDELTGGLMKDAGADEIAGQQVGA